MDVVFAAVVLAAEEEERGVVDGGGEEGRSPGKVDAKECAGVRVDAKGGGDGAAEAVTDDAEIVEFEGTRGGEGECGEEASSLITVPTVSASHRLCMNNTNLASACSSGQV